MCIFFYWNYTVVLVPVQLGVFTSECFGDLHIVQGMVYKSTFISGLTPPQFLDTKSSLNFTFVCDISMIMCLRFLRSGRFILTIDGQVF